MMRIPILILLVLNLHLAQKSARVLIDDLGREVTFGEVPSRIISLAPSITEFIYALEGEDKLVGNTTYCNFPPESEKITKVGDILTFDFELIVALQPDVIFITVEGNTKDSFIKLDELGLKTFIINPRNFEDIKKDFLKIADVLDKSTKAQEIVEGWNLRAEEIILKNQKLKEKSVMIIVEISPLMLAGKNTFLNEYLELCNLTNIASDSPLNYPVFSREEVLKRNPDFIVYPGGGTEDRNFLLNYYPEWKELKAFKEKKVIFVDRDMYFRPGPRFIDSLEDLMSRTSK